MSTDRMNSIRQKLPMINGKAILSGSRCLKILLMPSMLLSKQCLRSCNKAIAGVWENRTE